MELGGKKSKRDGVVLVDRGTWGGGGEAGDDSAGGVGETSGEAAGGGA